MMKCLLLVKVFFWASIFSCALAFGQDGSGAAVNPDPGETLSGDSAQNPDETGSFEVESVNISSGNETAGKVTQILRWQEGQFADRYVVVLEQKRDETGAYVYLREWSVPVGTDHIEVTMPAGSYRYKVTSYNIFGSFDDETDWEYIEVIKAIQPSIVAYTPDVFYFDRATPRIINLTGENLFPLTEIYLVSVSVKDENGAPFIIRPREIFLNEIGETGRIIFNEEDLLAGTYQIVAKNPNGGLEARTGPFAITMAKPYDINVSAGFSPLLTFLGVTSGFYDQVFNPISFTARADYIHFKWDIGFLGAELSPGWAYLSSESSTGKTSAHLVMVHVNALFQYWLIRSELALNSRAGIGIAGIFDYHFTFNSTGRSAPSMSSSAFTFTLGASVQWFLYQQFFIEGGLDFVQIAHPEVPLSFIRIGIFGGYQF